MPHRSVIVRSALAAIVLVLLTASAADAGPAPELIHTKHMHGGRYCEILLVHPGTVDQTTGIVADVYNTYSLNECPADQWATLDMTTVAAEQQVPVAIRNGPRFWLMDSIDKEPLADRTPTDFGGIGMLKLATVGLGSVVNPAPYSLHEVDRRTRFTFAKGRTVHELVAADGTVYVMQTWSQQIDPSLDEAGLAGLGSRLQLPEGWTYRNRKLKAPLKVVTLDHPAHVLQDELMNSYVQEKY